jgi:DNA-binding CsgD family transcriptional regulator
MIYSIRKTDVNKKKMIDQYKICRSRNSSKIYPKRIISGISHFGMEGLPKFNIIRNNYIIFQYLSSEIKIIKESKLPLTNVEFQLLRRVTRGIFSKDISRELNISIKTFYTNRRNIRDKMKMDINSLIAILR